MIVWWIVDAGSFVVQVVEQTLVAMNKELVSAYIPQYRKLQNVIQHAASKLCSELHAKTLDLVAVTLNYEPVPQTMDHYLVDAVKKIRFKTFEDVLNNSCNSLRALVKAGHQPDVYIPKLQTELLGWYTEQS